MNLELLLLTLVVILFLIVVVMDLLSSRFFKNMRMITIISFLNIDEKDTTLTS